MSTYHRYASAYPSPECHGKGYATEQKYIHVNSVGIYSKDCPSAVFLQHVRKDFYFSYTYDGGMFLSISGECLEIKPGDAFFLLPGQSCKYWYKDNGNTLNYFVHFTGYAAWNLLKAFDIDDDKQVMTIGRHLENGNLFGRIVDELEVKKKDYDTISAAYLMQLIAFASRQHVETNVTKSKSNQIITHSLQYIHENCGERLLVADLARKAAMSVNRFEIEFRRFTGVAPSRYILMYRIEKAIGYINAGDMSMRQIADTTGFENQMYFSRAFKKLVRLTPSQYRREYTAAAERN